MKALIRNKGETITEDMGITGIDWDSGYPLTNAKWFGGPYTLIMNYVPEIEEGDNLEFIRNMHEELAEEEPEEETPQEEDVVEDDDYVVINGVRYSKEELRRMIE